MTRSLVTLYAACKVFYLLISVPAVLIFVSPSPIRIADAIACASRRSSSTKLVRMICACLHVTRLHVHETAFQISAVTYGHKSRLVFDIYAAIARQLIGERLADSVRVDRNE